MPARNHIDLTVKTMKVLEALVENPEGASLKDLTLRVGLVKSSLFRILFTLKELGYVEQAGENGLYRLTFKTTGLVRRSVEGLTLAKLARPHLVRLRDRVQESAWLAEQRRHGIVLVDVAEAAHPLKLSFDVGDLCPVHATAVGKAIAAHLPAEKVEALLPKGNLPKMTPHTITSRTQLRTELARVRAQHYAVNAEETVKGVIIIGAPVFDSLGNVVAGISVSSPTARCSPQKRRELVEQVVATSRAISEDLRSAAFKATETTVQERL